MTALFKNSCGRALAHVWRLQSSLVLAALIPTMALAGFAQGPKPVPTRPAEKASSPTTPAVPVGAHELTASDLESFLDGLLPAQLERDDIAGAVIAVVKDGKVLFTKGYGYADVEKRKPVSPEDTLFRPGSISKLFTWTSVMQLVEQGKLDLDRNVNDYLDFKIPDTYPQPITLRNIMTHTAGFDESVKDLFIPDSKGLEPLGKYVATHMPRRIYPPGVTPAYSNYATTLAGYIVQRVSGQPFADYVDEHIFKPLDMPKTTFVQPLPADLQPLMSDGYRVASGGAKKFEVVQAFPAGSVSTNAIGMTHFMIAHLQNGEYNGARILKPETAELMHSRQFGANPATLGMCLGFYEETRNGHRIIGHGGDTGYFHSDLHIIPDANVGFFVSYNSAGRGDVSNRTELLNKFMDRYFPYSVPAEPTLSSAAADAASVNGTYMISRRSQGNVLGVASVLGETKVHPNPDNTLSVDAIKGFNGQDKKFREIAPLVFREVNGQDKIAFNRDATGNTVLAMQYPFMVFQRVGFFRGKGFNMFVLVASLAVLVLTILLWPIAAMARKHYGKRLVLSPTDRRLRFLVRLTCILDVAFVALLLGWVSSISSDIGALNSSIDFKLHFFQVVGLLGALGTIVAIYNAMRVWRTESSPVVLTRAAVASREGAGDGPATDPKTVAPGRRWLWTRLCETAIAVACIGFTWFVAYWGMLNFNLNF